MIKEYLNIKELSEYLGIKKSSLYDKVHRKEIPFYKIGRLVRFKKEEIDEWMSKNKNNPVDTDRTALNIITRTQGKEINVTKLVNKVIEQVKNEV